MKRNLKRIFGRPYETWKEVWITSDISLFINAMRFLPPRAILISFIHPWFIRLFRVASRMENFSCVATIKTFQRSKTLSDNSSYKSIPKES